MGPKWFLVYSKFYMICNNIKWVQRVIIELDLDYSHGSQIGIVNLIRGSMLITSNVLLLIGSVRGIRNFVVTWIIVQGQIL